MRGATHLAIGIAFGVGAASVISRDPTVWLPVVAGAAVGSLMPDADSPGGFYGLSLARRMWRRRWWGWKATGGLLWITLVIPRALALAFSLPHRGLLHSPWLVIGWLAAGLLLLPVSWALSALASGIGVGILSHLVADSLTRGGIRWGERRVSGPLHTGSVLETGIMVIALGAALVILYISMQR